MDGETADNSQPPRFDSLIPCSPVAGAGETVVATRPATDAVLRRAEYPISLPYEHLGLITVTFGLDVSRREAKPLESPVSLRSGSQGCEMYCCSVSFSACSQVPCLMLGLVMVGQFHIPEYPIISHRGNL